MGLESPFFIIAQMEGVSLPEVSKDTCELLGSSTGKTSGILPTSDLKDLLSDDSIFTFVPGKTVSCRCERERPEYMLFGVEDPKFSFTSIFEGTTWKIQPNEEGRHLRVDRYYNNSCVSLSPAHYTESYKDDVNGDIFIIHVFFSRFGYLIAIKAKLVKSNTQEKQDVLLNEKQTNIIKANAKFAKKKFKSLIRKYDERVKSLREQANELNEKLEELSKQILDPKRDIIERSLVLEQYEQGSKKLSSTIDELNKICVDSPKDLRAKIVKDMLKALESLVCATQVINKETLLEQIDDEQEIPLDADTSGSIELDHDRKIQSFIDKLISIKTIICRDKEQTTDKEDVVKMLEEEECCRRDFMCIDYKCELLTETSTGLPLELATLRKEVSILLEQTPAVKHLMMDALYAADVSVIEKLYEKAEYLITADLLAELFGICLYKKDLIPGTLGEEIIIGMKNHLTRANIINHETLPRLLEFLYQRNSFGYANFIENTTKSLLSRDVVDYGLISITLLTACCERGYFHLFSTLVSHYKGYGFNINRSVGLFLEDRDVYLSIMAVCINLLNPKQYVECLLKNGIDLDASFFIIFTKFWERGSTMIAYKTCCMEKGKIKGKVVDGVNVRIDKHAGKEMSKSAKEYLVNAVQACDQYVNFLSIYNSYMIDKSSILIALLKTIEEKKSSVKLSACDSLRFLSIYDENIRYLVSDHTETFNIDILKAFVEKSVATFIQIFKNRERFALLIGHEKGSVFDETCGGIWLEGLRSLDERKHAIVASKYSGLRIALRYCGTQEDPDRLSIMFKIASKFHILRYGFVENNMEDDFDQYFRTLANTCFTDAQCDEEVNNKNAILNVAALLISYIMKRTEADNLLICSCYMSIARNLLSKTHNELFLEQAKQAIVKADSLISKLFLPPQKELLIKELKAIQEGIEERKPHLPSKKDAKCTKEKKSIDIDKAIMAALLTAPLCQQSNSPPPILFGSFSSKELSRAQIRKKTAVVRPKKGWR